MFDRVQSAFPGRVATLYTLHELQAATKKAAAKKKKKAIAFQTRARLCVLKHTEAAGGEGHEESTEQWRGSEKGHTIPRPVFDSRGWGGTGSRQQAD